MCIFLIACCVINVNVIVAVAFVAVYVRLVGPQCTSSSLAQGESNFLCAVAVELCALRP